MKKYFKFLNIFDLRKNFMIILSNMTLHKK
jgi:hypothetical protein